MNDLPFRKYPSTTALQCFRASARYMSFTKAAEELHMTQSAVSKQVAHLEELIRQKLFIRTPQYLQITQAGNQYLSEVHHILNRIENSTLAMLAYGSAVEDLKLAAHPTLCSRWLTPLLVGFGKTYPNIRLDIRDKVASEIRDTGEPFDIAFLAGDGLWAGMDTIKLFNEESIVVCSPDIYEPAQQVVDLTTYTFLQIRSRPTHWQQYFVAQQLVISESFIGPKFDTFQACIAAAEVGCGLALIPRRFVQKELDEGRLICPWDYRFIGKDGYYMVFSTASSELPKVRTMLDWVISRL